MTETARPISADITGKLRVEILAERLKPGDKLTEQACCERYGASRTPVREALKHLEAEGLIEMIPNRGAFVVGLSENDLRDLYALREQNEMQAVCWAIERRTKAELEAIEESLDFMRFYTKRGDAKRMRSINAGFHRRITKAAHNRILESNLLRIQDYIRHSARVLPYRETDLGVILNEHAAIVAAFQNNDPAAGREAMKTHIENSRKRASLRG